VEHPVRVAFCKILFAENGGRFTENGLPVSDEDIRGLCDIAWDCASCTYLNTWVELLNAEGWESGWECALCLQRTRKADASLGVERVLPGFYSAGKSAIISPDDSDFDPDLPSLAGCTHICPPDAEHSESYVCGWQSSFLQLILRRIP
jgi:hypothetical protein